MVQTNPSCSTSFVDSDCRNQTGRTSYDNIFGAEADLERGAKLGDVLKNRGIDHPEDLNWLMHRDIEIRQRRANLDQRDGPRASDLQMKGALQSLEAARYARIIDENGNVFTAKADQVAREHGISNPSDIQFLERKQLDNKRIDDDKYNKPPSCFSLTALKQLFTS